MPKTAVKLVLLGAVLLAPAMGRAQTAPAFRDVFEPLIPGDPLGRGVFFVTLLYAGASVVLAIISVVWRRFQLSRLTGADGDDLGT